MADLGWGGLLLLEDLGITAIIPSSGVFFIVASLMVMTVGLFSFIRDLLSFLREPLAFLLAFLRLPSFPPSESTETFPVGEDVYEWDKGKRDEALEKHGVDFKDAGKVVGDPEQETVERRPLTDENGAYTGYEDRIRAFGRIDGKLHLVVYTMRGDNFRIISMRRVGEEELLPYKPSTFHDSTCHLRRDLFPNQSIDPLRTPAQALPGAKSPPLPHPTRHSPIDNPHPHRRPYPPQAQLSQREEPECPSKTSPTTSSTNSTTSTSCAA